jgi:AraC-like DNA-binding protein
LTHLGSSSPDLAVGAAPPSGPIRLSLGGAPERERPGLYREFFGRSVMRLDVEPLRDMPFEVDVTVQKLPGLQLFSGRLYGSRNRRTREMLADGNDDFSFMVNLGGPYLISQGQRELLLGDREATIVSCAEPCSFTHHPPGDVLALRMPRRAFAPLVANVEDCCLRRIPRDTPALKLLTDYVKVARNEQTISSRDVQRLVVAHAYDLMAVAIDASRDAAEAAGAGGVRAARLHAIKQDIAAHLGEVDLSVAALAVRHGCTPRCVQRLFEAEGTTFTEYVLAQRLALAHRLLSDPRHAGDKITDIAYDAGFGDVSYFNRAFRRHFGASPSDIRAHARQDAPSSLM